MTQTESALGSAGDILQRARELMVSAGNATYSDAERASIAGELRTLREQLFTIANQSDGAGTYLFGGQGATQKPFVDAPGGVQFAATGGETRTEAGTNLPLTTDGRAAWLSARTGNGVFVTAAGAGVTAATIDSGRVSDPSALTGADYTCSSALAAASPPTRCCRTACRPPLPPRPTCPARRSSSTA
jgi:flagellar hook-associated protein 3 FlgL